MKRGSWLINRRTLLRGAGGVAIGLPLLEVMMPPRRASADQAPPRRFLVFFKPGGTVMENWRPTGTETSFTLGRIQEPLLPFKDRLVILDGIDLAITAIGEGHPHSKGMGGLLTGRELPSGPYETCQGKAGFPAGPSIDQVIAAKIGPRTRFRSLEVAVNWPTDQRDGGKAAPTNCISFSGPGQPVPPSIDPRAVFDRVFADIGADAQKLALERARSKSILDTVMAEYESLAPRVGQADRTKLDEHFSRIREIEIALSAGANETTGACVKPMPPTPLGDPNAGHQGDPGSPDQINPSLDARMPELGKAMTDLLVMALACDLTRVGTMQWVDSQAYNTFPFLQLFDGHHSYQHDHGYQPDALTTIDTWYMTQFAYLLQRLVDVKENGASLLETTAVLYTSELQHPNSHEQTNMPFIVAGGTGGAIRAGRYLKYDGVPHNNLLVSLLNAFVQDCPMAIVRTLVIALACLVCTIGCFGDHFFRVTGSTTTCGTTVPIIGAVIVANVDKGPLMGPYNATYTTDATGRFNVHIADRPDDWVTLTFSKPGFSPFSQQFKGSTEGAVVCMTPSP